LDAERQFIVESFQFFRLNKRLYNVTHARIKQFSLRILDLFLRYLPSIREVLAPPLSQNLLKILQTFACDKEVVVSEEIGHI